MTRNEDFERMMRLAPRVRLGEVIEQTDNRNTDGKYGVRDVRGISILKKIIPTKADMTGVSLNPYKIVAPNEFCYVTVTSRNGEKISLAINDSEEAFIFSSSYVTFRIKDENILSPQYLYMLLNRIEFDRYARFNSWGSARETFDWSEMERVVIPLPSIEVQRELVAVYEGLRQTAEQNEALLKPLGDACHAYIVDCKEKYPAVKLGEYIEETDERNTNGIYSVKDVRGISIQKTIIPTKADMEGVSLKSYKVLNPKDLCVVTVTSRNGGKISLAINRDEKPYIFSSSYLTFKVKDNAILNPEYLYLIFARDEFDRYSRFNSWGSARETFDWSEMERVQIPLPPIEVQQSIVSLYRCAEEAKAIAQEARELMRTICPALIQRAAQGVKPHLTNSKASLNC